MALADRIRPTSLNEIVGQEHILKKDSILQKNILNGKLPHILIYGPPGVGKTTFATIISKYSNKKFYKLNAISSSADDIKSILNELDTFNGINGILLFVDEIGYFTTRQQQILLDRLEDKDSRLTLIGATTQNPYNMHKALLSRCLIIEFKQLKKIDILKGLTDAIKFSEKERNVNINCTNEALEHISDICEGDLRNAINFFEVILNGKINNIDEKINITIDDILELSPHKIIQLDKSDKYDLLSALQKSIRGSDTSAAIHYLARLIKTNDLQSICRRLSVIACEDVFGNAITVTEACVTAALRVGLPEARIHLSHAVLYLCLSIKSNSAIIAIDEALYDIENKTIGDMPNYLKDNHYAAAKKMNRGEGYKYPHDYKNHYIKQNYMPIELKNKSYYNYGNSKFEEAAKKYWEEVKKEE